ncbi:MAG: Gfo/Idh/MocA family oxidoreductase [Methanomassiliicoccales archaeon]|jgi:predicted dehydrogenase|nr:Gfo/Idh/MocA family oxidoreductase [Methanomassiliicoccales archaeon]
MRRFEVGVIGVGYWGRKIVDEYSGIPGVRVRGVADIDEKNLEYCKDRYGVEVVTRDYHEILADDSIVAVNVCVPNALHYQVCKDALEAGKHVLVEKPMTLTSVEGQKLVEIAEERNLTLSVGHIYRFNNALQEVKRLIGERFFGRIFFMNLYWVNFEPPYPDRDVIVDLAPHYFDIINFLLGVWPKKITCVGRPFRRKEMEETAYIISELPSGEIASASLSWLAPKKVRQIEIVGERRCCVIDAVGQEVTVYESGYWYKLGIERNNTIRTELLHFIKSIGDPHTETMNSGFVGVKTVEMIEKAKQSMMEGKTIDTHV